MGQVFYLDFVNQQLSFQIYLSNKNHHLLLQLFHYTNQLSSINVTNNPALVTLDVGSNELSSLDISKNTQLQILGVNDNNLTSLDLRNGNNTNISNNNFSSVGNSNLYCINKRQNFGKFWWKLLTIRT